MKYRLGIDIGGTKIALGLIQGEAGDATVSAMRRLEVTGVRDVYAELRSAAEALCTEVGISPLEVTSCGVGVPGTVSRDGRRILKAPNIVLLEENFADSLSDALGLPVTLVQDSRAAAWGEFLCGGGRGMESVVCVTLGTGIGTGIVLGGRIYHGALGTAGELGHLPVRRGGRPCGCGKRGCLEKYCAGGGLDRTARELLGSGKTARDLFAAEREGNADAKAAITHAVTLLGQAIVAAINLLSPNAVLFSGGLCEEKNYLEPLKEYVAEHCYVGEARPVLKKAELGALAPLVGAALCDLSE